MTFLPDQKILSLNLLMNSDQFFFYNEIKEHINYMLFAHLFGVKWTLKKSE
jgi:hypothetical protein